MVDAYDYDPNPQGPFLATLRPHMVWAANQSINLTIKISTASKYKDGWTVPALLRLDGLRMQAGNSRLAG